MLVTFLTIALIIKNRPDAYLFPGTGSTFIFPSLIKIKNA